MQRIMNDKERKQDKPGTGMTRRVLMALGLLVVLVYFYPHPRVSHYKYEEGRPWNYAKLIAPFDVPIHPDSATVNRAMDSLNASFVPVYKQVHFNVDSAINLIGRRMSAADNTITPGALLGALTGAEGFDQAMTRTLRQAYARGVRPDSLGDGLQVFSTDKARMFRGRVLSEVSTRPFVTVSALCRQLDSLSVVHKCKRAFQNAGIASILRPNIVCDYTETNRLYANDKALITIDRGVIQRGQTIIDKGAIVTPQDYTNLNTYETLLADNQNADQRSDLLLLLGQTLYVALMLTLFMAYLYFFERPVWDNVRAVMFLLIMMGIFFLLGVGADAFVSGAICVIPMAIVAVLVQAFFSGRLAIFTSMTLVLLCAGLTTTFALEYIAIEMAGVCAAVYSLRDLTRRSQILQASLYVAVGYLLAYSSVQLMVNGSFDDFSWRVPIMLIVSAILTSLAYVLMFVTERAFGFVSNITLVELADTNSPLLRQLSDECPGTFQHSMAVSTLATEAARTIGADTLLVRAGAMYHDIGKMANPIFYTENQRGVNPHDGLSPQRSAEIIIAHVPEGLKRAERANLPGVVSDFISQHHGRGKAKYFYITACKQNPDKEIDPAPFTYPGPNPQTREASVLMMADSVEAASRSLKEHTPQAIAELVDRIIDGQIAEGLHNESPISFRDVAAIKQAFIRRLTTIYHNRIAYPTLKS